MAAACSFSVSWVTLRWKWGGGGVVYLQVSLPLGRRGKSLACSRKHGGVDINDPGPSWGDTTPRPSVPQSDQWLALALGTAPGEPATC